MEIQIDTTIIHTSSTKLEETIRGEIENNHKLNLSFSQPRKYFHIQVHSFLLEEAKDLIIAGRITKNNQTFYDFDLNDNVLVLVTNQETINNFLREILKPFNSKEDETIPYEIALNVDDNLFYKVEEFKMNEIILPMIFFTTSIKLYFGFLNKFKFNKWDSVLINSEIFPQCYLMCKILISIGFDVTVNTSLLPKHEELNEQWDIDAYNKIKFIGWDMVDKSFANANKFSRLIDTTGESLSIKNKLSTLVLLRQNGSLHLIDAKPDDAQLVPSDLQILYDKNISINLTNLQNCIKFNYTVGKELNYLNEILEKLSKSYQSHIKSIIKKLECKIWDSKEKISELTLTNLTDGKHYMIMCILN